MDDCTADGHSINYRGMVRGVQDAVVHVYRRTVMPKGGSKTKRGQLYKKITQTKKKIRKIKNKIKIKKLMLKNKSRVISA